MPYLVLVSYRDDHDAALHRADALEVELRRVQAELDRARQPAEPPTAPKVPTAPREITTEVWLLTLLMIILASTLIATCGSIPAR